MKVIARTSGLAVWALVAGLWASSAFAEIPCTYHAAPVEKDGGRVAAGQPYGRPGAAGTPDRPMVVSDFWRRELARPGTALCLADGLYRGESSMIHGKGAPDGTPTLPIEVRAIHDGAVWIDGQFEHRTIRIRKSHWTVSGVNAFNSVGPPVGIQGPKPHGKPDRVPIHHVTLRRIVAWRDFLPYGSVEDYEKAGGPDTHIFDVSNATDLLVEDCAGFGWARKIFQNYRTQRVTFRRNWARWDGRHPYRNENEFAFSCSDGGYDALCENLIATVGGSDDEAAAPGSYSPSLYLIATDGSDWATGKGLDPPGRDVHTLNLRILGSLAYTRPGTRFERVAGYHVGGAGYPIKGQKGVRIENSVGALDGPGEAFQLQDCKDDEEHPDGCSWKQKDDQAAAPLVVSHVTAVGPRKPPVRIGRDWRQQDVVQRAPGKPLDIHRGTGGGAVLCHRTIDGAQTDEPLWPWPMQERIRAATERSNWETADVMGEITAIFGPPPAACTR